MRRKDRALSEQEAWALLEEGRWGVLSINDVEGYPYGIPMYYTILDEKICMHGANADGLMEESIKADPKVSFTVVQRTEPLADWGAKSVIAFGIMRLAPDLYTRIMETTVERYIPEPAWEAAKKGIPFAKDHIAAYEMTVEHLTAKNVVRPEGV